MTGPARAARPHLPPAPPFDPTAPGQFAFADRDRTATILTEAGWNEVAIEPLDLACVLPAAAIEPYLTRMGALGRQLSDLEPQRRERALTAARQALEPHLAANGDAHFTAACWLLTATA